MRILVTLALCAFACICNAQAADPQNISVNTDREPAYPGGDRALYTYVMYNLKYPEEAVKNYAEGEVTLSFDIRPDSTVSNVVLLSGVGYGVDDALKKLVAGLKFIPAMQNGSVVKMNTIYSFPVKAH